jgi:[protein-PII] uridylyltransferase
MRTARLQDLKSPAVIQQVAEKCRTTETLRHLYVFTYADTRAVAERNWTSMDYRDLEDLYRKVQELLQGQGQELPTAASIESKIVQIRRRLSAGDRPVDEEAIQRHCDSLSAAYVLNTPLEEIELHLDLLGRLGTEGVVVDIYNRPGEDFSELTVCTRDDPRPGMLAKITGVLYGCNVDIHRAQLYTMRREPPIVLDTLWVRSGASPISENRARRIQAVLKDVLGGATTVDRFLKGVGKQPPEVVPVEGVELRNDLSEEHTVVRIIARDLQGLLYLMTRALSRNGLHIHSAKVATWNARAENNFYVTALTGGQIPAGELEQWRKQLLNALAGG